MTGPTRLAKSLQPDEEGAKRLITGISTSIGNNFLVTEWLLGSKCLARANGSIVPFQMSRLCKSTGLVTQVELEIVPGVSA